MSKPKQPHNLKTDTLIVTGGRTPSEYFGFVNPPVYHASTVLYPTAADMVAHRGRYRYGRRGTPT
jgi:cystathionine beta-lyase